MNHKNAFEYLYDHLSLDSIFEVHKRLTDDHGLPELHASPHFLQKEQLGNVREYEEVRINTTTYSPPFRPGTGYIRKMLERILETSTTIADPIESAFYLFTRIPYLQPFADGNKRTSRALCNVPLMLAGMPPISFMDFSKRDYIVSILSFYELGDSKFAAATFTAAYLKSCHRLRPR
ncbi:MAG: Fic family protein [Gallionellaceae bacterium]